jgi:hypothetical protein
MNRYDNVTGKGERDMFGKKMPSGGGMSATDIWMWCGLCVVMLGVVGILSGGGRGGRVLRCDEGIYEDVVSGEVGLSVLCGWEYPSREINRAGWENPSDVEEEELIEWDVASYE